METAPLKTAPQSAFTVQDKLGQAWLSMINCIAHDLINLLVISRMKTERLQDTMLLLQKNYYLAAEQHMTQSDNNFTKVKPLEETFILNFQKEITAIMNFLDNLPQLAKQVTTTSDTIQALSAKNCLTKLLESYPLTDEQRHLIQIDCNTDFIFQCAPLFIESLLYHLLDMALDRVREKGAGTITLWLTHNTLHIKDTGKNMSEELLNRIFKRFFISTSTNTDIVPDIGFCRLAILQAGGDVVCESVEDEYTHFKIMFP